jgi:hypothetical protein
MARKRQAECSFANLATFPNAYDGRPYLNSGSVIVKRLRREFDKEANL